ncbi:MAG: hypothetical protein JOZ41_01460, partial [Chloroflexi bacterium]|nr:hypothetical protein [Chloroflexota bacterium]
MGQQVPLQQVLVFAQQAPGAPQQLCPAAQQTPLQQTFPLAQQVALQTWVLLGTQLPLQEVVPDGQPQVQLVGSRTWPPVQAATQVGVPPVGVQQVLPAAQQVVPHRAVAQTQVHPGPSVCPEGQFGVQVPLHSVWPAGQAQVQVVWLSVWPPVQLVMQVLLVVHSVVPEGQAQVQLPWLRTWPPVQAVTQRGVAPPVALQNSCPLGQAQVQLGPATWPPTQVGTQLVTPALVVHRRLPAVHWQVQVAELRTWPLPAGQVATQLS